MTLRSQLHTASNSLAQRRGLILAGDFNCCLTAGYPTTGTNVFTHGGGHTLGTQHKLVMQHGLVALNCWDDRLGWPYLLQPTGSGVTH